MSIHEGRALAELAAATWSASPGKIPIGPAAGVISKWYTVGIADLDFRLVDIRKPEPLWEQYGQDARRGQEQDRIEGRRPCIAPQHFVDAVVRPLRTGVCSRVVAIALSTERGLVRRSAFVG